MKLSEIEEIDGQLSLWDMAAKDLPDDEVKVDGAYNLKKSPIKQYNVTLTYGDLALIVTMIEDYLKGLNVLKAGDVLWETYYSKRFKVVSERIQKAIEYDYEEHVKKCLKKADKEKESDIGDEAMSLLIKKAEREAKQKETEQKEEGKDNAAGKI